MVGLGRKFLIHYYINIDITINIIVIILLMLYITPILRYIMHYIDVFQYIYIYINLCTCRLVHLRMNVSLCLQIDANNYNYDFLMRVACHMIPYIVISGVSKFRKFLIHYFININATININNVFI